MVSLRRLLVKNKDNVTMVAAVTRRNKVFLGVAASLLVIILFFSTNPRELQVHPQSINSEFLVDSELFKVKVEDWWKSRHDHMKNLSKLGEVMFLNASEPKIEDPSKRYQILVWKYGPTIENRHLKNFSGKKVNPFEYCPVNNCDITYEDSALSTADLVIFHLHRLKGLEDLPKERNYQQIWAFLTDESPHHTFLNSKNPLKDFNNLFNWSMTYRSDSDIPVPYGRSVLKDHPEPPVTTFPQSKRRDVLVATLGSNCGGENHRWQYVKELQKHIEVHVYGGCGSGPLKKECPGHFTLDCNAIDNYLFYLAFENSNCDEYITEKLWWNAYHKESIPIVMGSSQETYKNLLPVGSYINVDDYSRPASLAQYLLSLNRTEEFTNFYRWKSYFTILNEHGYFQSRSYHYCRACQALNYNSKEKKVYEELEKFWSVGRDCHLGWDDPVN